jgi:hypothetical protein
VTDLAELTSAIVARLRDPQADFQVQACARGEDESLWLTRQGNRVTLAIIGPGGGEVVWEESAFHDADPQQAFDQLGERIELVVLHAGGPFPDELRPLFVADESQPVARYKAEWPSWSAFRAWLGPAPRS